MMQQSAIQPAAIIEMDQERDRKTCISLDLKVNGANQELAQWIADHNHRYSDLIVAGWLGCSKARIGYLRRWARNGFGDSPFGGENRYPDQSNDHHGDRGALKTNDNSESDDDTSDDNAADNRPADDVAAPEEVEDNILYGIQRINANAKAYSKILRASALDREAAERINTAIERMIEKWRSIQSTLAKKG